MKHQLCSQIQKQISFNPLTFIKNVTLQDETTENDNHILTTRIAEFLCKRYTNMCTVALGKCSDYPKFTCLLCLDYVAFWMIWTKLTYYTVAYRQPTVQWMTLIGLDTYTSENLFCTCATIIINLKPMLKTICQNPCPKITQCLNDHCPMSLLQNYCAWI
jgi:hypothetical protein